MGHYQRAGGVTSLTGRQPGRQTAVMRQALCSSALARVAEPLLVGLYFKMRSSKIHVP